MKRYIVLCCIISLSLMVFCSCIAIKMPENARVPNESELADVETEYYQNIAQIASSTEDIQEVWLCGVVGHDFLYVSTDRDVIQNWIELLESVRVTALLGDPTDEELSHCYTISFKTSRNGLSLDSGGFYFWKSNRIDPRYQKIILTITNYDEVADEWHALETEMGYTGMEK